ncbi:MAG: serine hydrolase [Candidatus Zixiibacteriota bacterium]|nr:MAG: serine hydrolase [candidate division Zixibacteria bacterium]
MKRKATGLFVALLILNLGGVAYPNDDFMKYPTIPDIFDEEPIVKEIGVLKEPPGGILLGGDCSDFIDLSGLPLPIEQAGSTIGATNDYGPYSARPTFWWGYWYSLSSAGPDVTYKWTAPAHGSYTISVCESDYDNCLQIYDFTCPDEPVTADNFIIGADDVCVDNVELRHISLTQGEEILIVVDGYGNNSGNFVLRIYETLINDIDWFIETQMEMFHVPGIAACIVKDDSIDWTGSYGYANIEDSIHVADSTLFYLASISKTFVGVAMMKLWEDSLFALDDDINDYLPFSVRNPAHPSIPITFRMLMVHTSGISNNWDIIYPLITWGADSPIPMGVFLEEFLTPGGMYYEPQNYNSWAPGTQHAYSNIGAALGGYLVKVINPDSLPFDQYCNNYIFDSLGMDETAWFLSGLDTNNIAIPYSWSGSQFVRYPHSGIPYYPAAQLRTSSVQLARHLIATMQYGQIEGVRILDSASVDLMTTVQYPGISPNCGLFWFYLYWGDRMVWGHSGGWWGALTAMYYYPEENNGVVYLSNADYHNPEAGYGTGTIVDHLFERAAGPHGFVAGIVTGPASDPIDHVYANTIGYSRMDYSNPAGEYYIGGLVANIYDVYFYHPAYVGTVVTDVTVSLADTTYLDITLRSICDYVTGDVNGSDSYNGLDITYGVAFFKGGPAPTYECECPPHGTWFVSGDVNGSCSYNGLDITYGVAYFKGGPAPIPCPDCPAGD